MILISIAALPNGVRSSAIQSSLLRRLTTCSTTAPLRLAHLVGLEAR